MNYLQQIEAQSKKNPTPSPAAYDNNTLKTKSVSLVAIDRAENTNYLDAVMCRATEIPGIG